MRTPRKKRLTMWMGERARRSEIVVEGEISLWVMRRRWSLERRRKCLAF
jgi:hypothetical protein